MTTAYQSSQPGREAHRSRSQSWGIALTGVIGSGKTTVAAGLAHLLEWRIVSSGDVARAVDSNTAKTGAMANADALDDALLPMLQPGPVILDGYPRTVRQMIVLPPDILIVGLQISHQAALNRIMNREKHGWDEQARMREQAGSLRDVMYHADLRVEVEGKTPGEVLIEILSSEYLGPPRRQP